MGTVFRGQAPCAADANNAATRYSLAGSFGNVQTSRSYVPNIPRAFSSSISATNVES